MNITREVVDTRLYVHCNGGRWTIILICGHEHTQKKHVAVPKKARGRSCENLRGGGSSCVDNGDGTMQQWGWDEEQQWPTIATVPSTFERRS